MYELLFGLNCVFLHLFACATIAANCAYKRLGDTHTYIHTYASMCVYISEVAAAPLFRNRSYWKFACLWIFVANAVTCHTQCLHTYIHACICMLMGVFLTLFMHAVLLVVTWNLEITNLNATRICMAALWRLQSFKRLIEINFIRFSNVTEGEMD